jgi:hypothetical protein
MTDDTSVALSKPLTTHNGELSKLTLREPTARSFFEHGEPFKTRVGKSADGETTLDFEYDYKVFSKFLTEMVVEGVDDLVLGSLRPIDFFALRTKATHLIIGLTGTSSP